MGANSRKGRIGPRLIASKLRPFRVTVSVAPGAWSSATSPRSMFRAICTGGGGSGGPDGALCVGAADGAPFAGRSTMWVETTSVPMR